MISFLQFPCSHRSRPPRGARSCRPTATLLCVLALAVLFAALTAAEPGRADAPAASGKLRTNAPPAGQRPPLILDMLTFNAYLRPFVPEWQDRRAPLMAGQLKGYDVVLLQEVFSDWHRDLVLDALTTDYPYRTRVLGHDQGFRQDGGVMILSRWPIEQQFQRRFGARCTGKDCLADKGVLYARIRRADRRFHVFATHLQSGADNAATRTRQLGVIRQLIDSMALPADEPVLIGGDLNIDLYSDRRNGAYSAMARILRAAHPAAPDGQAHQPTLGQDDDRPGSADPSYVDYLLYSTAHLRPRVAFTAARGLFAEGMALSDHFAVHGHFEFDAPPQQPQAERFAFVELFDGPDTARDFICNVALQRDSTIDLRGNDECGHAKARAFRLRDVPAGRVIRFHGSGKNSGWVQVKTRRFISSLSVSSLDARLDNEDVLITRSSDARFRGAIAGIEDVTTLSTARLAR